MTLPDERDGGPSQGDPFGSRRRRGVDERGGRIALAVAVPGLVLSVLFFPLGLVLDVGAIVVGVRALRRAERAPGAIAGVVLGSLGAVLVAMVIALLGVFWQEVRAYQECMSGANTISTQEQCRAEFKQAIETRLGVGR